MALLLGQDRLDHVVGQVGVVEGAAHDPDAALGLLLEHELGRVLVEADPEALELVLDFLLVGERLERVEDEQDQVAGARDADDLLAAALAVLGALDDAGQVEQLDGGPVLLVLAGDAGQRRELLGRHLRLHVRHLLHQRRLAHRGEADHRHAAVARLRHVEALAAALLRRLGLVRDDLRLQFRQPRFQQSQVVFSRFVFLRPFHFLLDLSDFLMKRHLNFLEWN